MLYCSNCLVVSLTELGSLGNGFGTFARCEDCVQMMNLRSAKEVACERCKRPSMPVFEILGKERLYKAHVFHNINDLSKFPERA